VIACAEKKRGRIPDRVEKIIGEPEFRNDGNA
jgi:hypothetical protein